MRGLSRDTAKRQQTVARFAEELTGALDGSAPAPEQLGADGGMLSRFMSAVKRKLPGNS